MVITSKALQGGHASTCPSLASLPDLLDVPTLCEITGLSAQTIRGEINGGNLPGCRIGRRLYVSKAHFIDYIENGGGLHDYR